MAGVIRGLLGANSLLVDFFPILCYNKKIPLSERFTTKNGQEIENPTEKMTYEQFRDVVSREYGLSGESPEARAKQLKELSSEQVFSLMDTLNKSVQGSKDSLEQTDHAMRIGEMKTIDVEHRQMVLEGVVGALRNTPDSISAQRVGDVLALTTAMLHPFMVIFPTYPLRGLTNLIQFRWATTLQGCLPMKRYRTPERLDRRRYINRATPTRSN